MAKSEEIYAATLRAWPAEEGLVVDGWRLRMSADQSRRANAMWPLRYTCTDPAASLKRAHAWYAERGQALQVKLMEGAQPGELHQLLAAQGYQQTAASSLLTHQLGGRGQEMDTTDDTSITLESRPTALVMNALSPTGSDPTARRNRAALFSRIRKPLAFAVMSGDAVRNGSDDPAAGALGVVDGPLLGIYALHCHSRFHRQGAARRIVRRLMAWGHSMGADVAYLQVEDANPPAVALFTSLGFARISGYRYMLAPDMQPDMREESP